MKRSPADERVRHAEVRVCQGERWKARGIIACVDVALVIVVAVVVDGRGYGGVCYLDGSSSLAGRSNCEGGGKGGKRSVARC